MPKEETLKKYLADAEKISIDDEINALSVIELIQQTACTDSIACKTLKHPVYKFWLVRMHSAEIAAIYQLASDARAQSHVDKALTDITELESEIKAACTTDGQILDKAQMHALVALSRTKYIATIQYAKMTDAKRWADKVQLSGDDSIDIATIVSSAKAKREQARAQIAQASIDSTDGLL